MHIAVDVCNIKCSEEEQCTLALLQQLLLFRPDDHFTIIATQAGLLPPNTNVSNYIVKTAPASYFQLRSWYGKTLPALLQQMDANVLISINGVPAKSPVPQVVFLSSPYAAERVYAGSNFSFLYKWWLKKRLNKATAIITFTKLQQQFIVNRLHVQPALVTPVGYAVPAVYSRVSWQHKDSFLQELTNGNEYFLYTGSFEEPTFLLVLKAFSLFKKRQLSSMQLITAGHFSISKALTEKLETYKYRVDVKLYPATDIQTMASFVSGAYALLYLDEPALTAFPVATAVQCGIPAIYFKNTLAAEELTKETARYCLPTVDSLADSMKLLYKDENLRQQLVANTVTQRPLADGTIAAQKFWDCLLIATTKNRLHLPPQGNLVRGKEVRNG